MNWIECSKGLPEQRKWVLCQIAEKPLGGLPPAVAVGYWKKQSDGPLWIIPGIGGFVTHWCDFFENFTAPLWEGTNPQSK